MLEDLERLIQYAIGRAEYYERELERGRTEGYATYDGAYNLAVLALDEFSYFNRWLFDSGPAHSLIEEMERGVGLELEAEYDALLDTLLERQRQTQRMLFANAEELAEAPAQKDEVAAKRREMEDSNEQLARRIA